MAILLNLVKYVMLAMIHTTATIVTNVPRNTRTTETIDRVGATSTVLAWIRTAFVDFYNTPDLYIYDPPVSAGATARQTNTNIVMPSGD